MGTFRRLLFAAAFASAMCMVWNFAAPAADLPPSVLFSKLLDSTKLWCETGEFEMQSMWAVFLPVAGDLSINAEDHLTTSIVDSSGSVLATFDWYVNKSDPPFWEMSHYECDQASGGRISMKKPGDYEARFYVNTALFYTFPFSVVEVKSSDPYNPATGWFLDGAWSDYAYFAADPSSATDQLFFKVFLHADRTIKDYDHEYNAKVKLYRNSKLVAMYNEANNTNCNITKEWQKIEFPFTYMTADGGEAFLVRDFYATDGSYSCQLLLDDKLYGKYDFAISGGKFVYQDRQVRGGGDYYPKMYIEGGAGAYWVKRKTG